MPRISSPVRHVFRVATVTLAVAALSSAATGQNRNDPALQDQDVTFAGSYLAGLSASHDNDIDSAIDFFDQALSLDSNDPALVERTLMLRLAGGQVDSALSLTDLLTEMQPDHWLANLALAVADFKAKDYGSALQKLKNTGQGSLTELTSGLLAAWAKLGTGATEEAMADIDALDGPEWFDIFKNYHSALIADVGGMHDEAITRMEKSFTADSSALRVAEATARLQARAGHPEKALEAFAEYRADGRSHPVIDRLSAAISRGEKPAPTVADATEGAAEVLYGIGALIGTEGGGELAATYLNLSLHLHPDNDVALMSLGDLLQRTARYSEAIEVFDRVGRDSPMYDRSRVQIGATLDLLGETDRAIDQLDDIVESDPSNLDAVLALSNIYRGEEKYQESADVLSAGIATVDKPIQAHWRLYYFRGIAYERTKQWPLAEADFKQALELYPDQPQVLNYLGYSWVDMGMNLTEALDMIRTAVDLSPDDGYIVDSLGWAYYRLGRYDDAVGELERAVELKPDDPVINDHLGDAYWKVGRLREAKFQWAHARDFEPEPDALPLVLAKLEKGLDAATTMTDADVVDAQDEAQPQPESETEAVAAVNPDAAATVDSVEVAPGDSLWSIAEHLYGNPDLYYLLYKANRSQIDDPDLIFPGMTLNVPAPPSN